jgi:uncharacterized protein
MLLIFFAPVTLAASFDCTKASTKVEKSICSNYDLGYLDFNIGSFYQKLIENPNLKFYVEELRKSQREWLVKRNSSCEASTDIQGCLNEIYFNRLISLTEKYIGYSGLAFYEFACDMGGNQSELNACARREYDLSVEFYSRTLNRVLKEPFSNDYGPSKEAIIKSAESWQQYVERHCSILQSWGGSMAPMQKHLCLMKKYKERTLEVATYLCSPAVECAFINP